MTNSIYQTILSVQRQHPEWLKEKYRGLAWESDRYQTALNEKVAGIFESAGDGEEAIAKLRTFLQKLLVDEFFSSSLFREMLTLLRVERRESQKARSGIAILLLDAENLQLDGKTELFLTSVCTCPLRVKIAFADWKNLGKLDRELHDRGYDLIHVPGGRDHADGKMIAVGSSLHEHYPQATEVLVCSSDTVMTNLCNHLQKKGLIVYRIGKHGELIGVLNCQTNEIQTHAIGLLLDIPSINEFTKIVKKIIKEEQKISQSHWIKLSQISQLFKNQYKLSISQVISSHIFGKKAIEFFSEDVANFAIHKPSSSAEFYISLFEQSVTQNTIQINNDDLNSKVQKSELPSINSSDELEQVILEIANTLVDKSGTFIEVGLLGAAFRKQYGVAINKIVKQLKVASNFSQFLQSSKRFKLKKTSKSYQVALTEK
ncbi:MAG: NYN domain-containing protein [Cyanobacteriota bacterium]|nr:NYN domain-containing protein [Cyanobacteriota bacterium]